MWKSGLIFAVVMLLLGTGFSLLSPLCVPCLSIFVGLATGYLAGVFDKPGNNGSAVKAGALAGVIGGLGALIGQIIGGVINSFVANPQTYGNMMRQFGMEFNEAGYWAGRVASVCCGGIFDVLLMAGLGAVGGLLWWQFSGQKSANTSVVNM
jgi:hypothetical protein